MTNETTGTENTVEVNEAAAPATAGKNDKRRSDLTKHVKKLGEEAGLGRDSLPKLAQVVVRAAFDGVIKADDAAAIYTEYSKAEGNKSIHEHSAASAKAQISKLRQVIALGEMTTVDGADVLQRAFEIRASMQDPSSPEYAGDGAKFLSAYPYYVNVARGQLKTDVPLDDSTLRDMAVKPEAAPKELEKELNAIFKRLEALVTGERKDGLKDDHEFTEAAMHQLKDRLDAMATLRTQKAVRDAAAAAGIALA